MVTPWKVVEWVLSTQTPEYVLFEAVILLSVISPLEKTANPPSLALNWLLPLTVTGAMMEVCAQSRNLVISAII